MHMAASFLHKVKSEDSYPENEADEDTAIEGSQVPKEGQIAGIEGQIGCSRSASSSQFRYSTLDSAQ